MLFLCGFVSRHEGYYPTIRSGFVQGITKECASVAVIPEQSQGDVVAWCARDAYTIRTYAPYIYPKNMCYTCTSATLVSRDQSEQCPRYRENTQRFKEMMSRPTEDHLRGFTPGVPLRLHQVVAFLEHHFEPEQVSFRYFSIYALRSFLIDVTKGERTIHLKCDRAAGNITYTSGFFAEEDESDREIENGHSASGLLAEEDEVFSEFENDRLDLSTALIANTRMITLTRPIFHVQQVCSMTPTANPKMLPAGTEHETIRNVRPRLE